MAKKTAKVKPKLQPGRMSLSAVAHHCCTSVVSFSRLLDKGVIKRQKKGDGYDPDECRAARFKHLENLAAGRSGEDGGQLLSKQRARLPTAQADAQVFKTGIMSGEYVRLSTFIKVAQEHIIMFREIALNTPGKISDTVAEISGVDRALIFNIIDAEIREMLTRMSTRDVVVQASDNTKQAREAAEAALNAEGL